MKSTSAVLFMAAAAATTMGSVSAFAPLPANVAVDVRSSSSSTSSTTTTQLMGGASGYATSLDGKKARVETLKGLLDTSTMVFTVPASSFTVAQSQKLRRMVPEGTTVTVIKNKVMARAIEGTEYAAATELLKGANMWFFIENDIGGTIKTYNGFLKEVGKLETHKVLGGVMEGTVFDQQGVAKIGELPSKDELYARIAGSILAVPTKVARVIKAPNSKLARAIKLATEKNNE